MIRLFNLADTAFSWLENRIAPWLLPSLARFTFAATLLIYFWHSAMLKVGPGLLGVFQPSLGAYAQIFPKAMEAAGYDAGALSLFHSVVVIAGTLAEFVLPLLIVVGLMTRLAAVGMIGFVVVQTLTDLYGHGALAQAETLGAWFDRVPDSLIMDQRMFWLVLLAVPALLGAGPLSLDRLFRRQ